MKRLVFIFLLLFLAVSFSSLANAESNDPSVSITNPSNNAQVVAGSEVAIEATASASAGINRVVFHVNNAEQCTDYTSPYTCNWKVPESGNTSYTVKAWAIDNNGNKNSTYILVTTQSSLPQSALFPTFDQVMQMINDALASVIQSISDLTSRIVQVEQDVAGFKTKKSIVDVQAVRGSLWTTSDTNPNGIKTPDEVTVNCPKACLLWVNYDVDTRNTNGSIAQSSWPQHLYHIYVDGINQAIFNQASMIIANAAIPLAVNGVIPVSAGQHTVTIYARTTGGTLEQHESHLQVMAIEQ